MLFFLNVGQLAVETGDRFLDLFTSGHIVRDRTGLDNLRQLVDHCVDIRLATHEFVPLRFQHVNTTLWSHLSWVWRERLVRDFGRSGLPGRALARRNSTRYRSRSRHD